MSVGTQLGEGGGRPPLPFFENQKECSNFREKGPYCAPPWVKFSVQNVVWRVSSRKHAKIFPGGAFFSWLFDEIFIKVPFPLPGKVFDCAPGQ